MTHAAPATSPNLPANIAALRALVLTTRAERDAAVAERNEAAAERDALATQNDRLRHLLVKLQRLLSTNHSGSVSGRTGEDQPERRNVDGKTVSVGRCVRNRRAPGTTGRISLCSASHHG